MASTQKKRPKIRSSSDSLLPSSKDDFFRLVAVIIIAASVALFCNFIATPQYQQPKLFCDSDHFLDDNCEPCPSNGRCYEGKLECNHGYVNEGRLCVEDREINIATKILTKLIEVRVCETYIQYLCSGTGAPWLVKDELWMDLDKQKVTENFDLDENTYMIAKLKAVEASRQLLSNRTNDEGFEEFKCPESLVDYYKPTSCHIREWIIKHAFDLVLVCALLLGCTVKLLQVLRRHKFSIRAEEAYNQICDILEEKALSSRMNGEGEPWVVASWLRDHVLTVKERKDPVLWEKVKEFLEQDSRLEWYPKMVKGESKVVWEWQVEGHIGKRKKAKETTKQKAVGSQIQLSTNKRGNLGTDNMPLNCMFN